MNSNLVRSFSKAAALLFLGAVVALGATGCVDTYTTAPVYRGAYYAFDAYPYGYNGYPGYPYYGAPFGGGASAVVVERSGSQRRYEGDGRQYRRDGSRRRHARHGTRVHRANTEQAPEETTPIRQR